MFNVLTVSWASVTVVLVGLLIYRALIGMREEDQLFLATGEEHQARRAAGPAGAHLQREQVRRLAGRPVRPAADRHGQRCGCTKIHAETRR